MDIAPVRPPPTSTTTTNNSLPRGRAPKDPHAQTFTFQCSSLVELENTLRTYLSNPPGQPEHSTCELTVYGAAAFDVHLSRNPHFQPGPIADNFAANITMPDALNANQHPTEAMNKQRAIAKACVEAVQRVDGFRYSFHNKWKSGEDNAHRFSYYCNDSFLNKDRVANGKAGSQGKRATKPVYDCKGVLAVKFSAAQQTLTVVYRHIPLHETYEERAPIPRKDSKRRMEWEQKNPDKIRGGTQSRQSTGGAIEVNGDNTSEARAAKKRKRNTIAVSKPSSTAEADLRQESLYSLLELIRTDKDDGPGASIQDKENDGRLPDAPNASNTFDPVLQAQASNRIVFVDGDKTKRPKVSCAICRGKKSRCDGIRPTCGPCAKRSIACHYTEPPPETAPAIVNNGHHISAQPRPTSQSQSYTQVQAQVQAQQAQITATTQENQELKSALQELRNEMNALKDQLTASQEKIKQLETDKSNSQAESAAAQQQAAQAQAQAQAAQAQAQAAQAQRERTRTPQQPQQYQQSVPRAQQPQRQAPPQFSQQFGAQAVEASHSTHSTHSGHGGHGVNAVNPVGATHGVSGVGSGHGVNTVTGHANVGHRQPFATAGAGVGAQTQGAGQAYGGAYNTGVGQNPAQQVRPDLYGQQMRWQSSYGYPTQTQPNGDPNNMWSSNRMNQMMR